jgi:hypothetical protein
MFDGPILDGPMLDGPKSAAPMLTSPAVDPGGPECAEVRSPACEPSGGGGVTARGCGRTGRAALSAAGSPAQSDRAAAAAVGRSSGFLVTQPLITSQSQSGTPAGRDGMVVMCPCMIAAA